MNTFTFVFKEQLVDPSEIWEKGNVEYKIPRFLGVNTRDTITLHETSNERIGADAQAHADLQSNGYTTASWHYQGDDKQVIQSWPETYQLWHSGDGSKKNGGNTTSVAYELCVNQDIDISKSRDIAAQFFAFWLKERGLDERAIRFHKDWSGKNCPAKILNEGYRDTFVSQVKTYLQTQTQKKEAEGTDMSRQTVNVSGVPVPPGTYEAFKKLASAFKNATGYTLLITSGYRTYAQQKSLYDRWRAGTFKAPSVARPGTSLHESGRALDIRDSGSDAGVTVAGNVRSNWIRNNAAKYGFQPNGYNFGEPWHIEYQGNPWSTTGSSSTSTTNYNPNGYDKNYIKGVQQLLIQNGYSVGKSGADSIMGKDTFNAVVEFQKANGLVPDGIPGSKTLNALSQPKSKVTSVEKLQKAVRSVVDNIVGRDTRKRVDAVRKASRWGGQRFPYGVKYTQRVVGAKDDGIWGRDSKAKHDNTVRKIQAAVGVKQDSIWGPDTDKAVKALGA